MNIATIQSIAPEGQPWSGQDGTLNYPQRVVFSDGTNGVANAKSAVPPYKVGDSVGYEVTGTDKRGNTKLKINRKAAQGAPAGSTPQPAQQNASTGQGTAFVGQPANPHSQTMIHPATAGCAFKAAIEVLCLIPVSEDAQHITADMREVHKLASGYVRVLQALEAGKLATPAVVQQAQALAAQHGFVTSAVAPSPNPRPGPNGQVNTDDADTDVPY